MEIIVHGRNTSVSEDDRARIEARIRHAVRVFPRGVERVDVELALEPNPRLAAERHRVEATAAVAGRIVRIETGAATLDSALDEAVERLTRQLRRLKERRIDSHRRAEDQTPPSPPHDTSEIVRVKQFVMKPMNVEEAVLQMEMLGHSFFLFHNAATDSHSVLYRRRDGRLGLIEPS